MQVFIAHQFPDPSSSLRGFAGGEMLLDGIIMGSGNGLAAEESAATVSPGLEAPDMNMDGALGGQDEALATGATNAAFPGPSVPGLDGADNINSQNVPLPAGPSDQGPSAGLSTSPVRPTLQRHTAVHIEDVTCPEDSFHAGSGPASSTPSRQLGEDDGDGEGGRGRRRGPDCEATNEDVSALEGSSHARADPVAQASPHQPCAENEAALHIEDVSAPVEPFDQVRSRASPPRPPLRRRTGSSHLTAPSLAEAPTAASVLGPSTSSAQPSLEGGDAIHNQTSSSPTESSNERLNRAANRIFGPSNPDPPNPSSSPEESSDEETSLGPPPRPALRAQRIGHPNRISPTRLDDDEESTLGSSSAARGGSIRPATAPPITTPITLRSDIPAPDPIIRPSTAPVAPPGIPITRIAMQEYVDRWQRIRESRFRRAAARLTLASARARLRLQYDEARERLDRGDEVGLGGRHHTSGSSRDAELAEMRRKRASRLEPSLLRDGAENSGDLERGGDEGGFWAREARREVFLRGADVRGWMRGFVTAGRRYLAGRAYLRALRRAEAYVGALRRKEFFYKYRLLKAKEEAEAAEAEEGEEEDEEEDEEGKEEDEEGKEEEEEG